MPETKTFNDVCDVIRSVVKLEDGVTITPESSLVDDLGVDSLDLVSLFLDVQDTFGVVIDEDDLSKIVTVGDLVGHVSGERTSSQAA
jgi:acyl carrier protein